MRGSARWPDAKQAYEQILQQQPDDAQAIIGLARCLTELGDANRGLAEARRAAALVPDDLICINELAVMLFNIGKVEESLEWAKRAVEMGPEGAKTHALIANCHEKLHRIDEAIEANRLAQIANPQVPYLRFQEGKLRARLGDDEGAREILQATSREPGLPPELKRQLFSELGKVLDRLELYDLAFDAFMQSGVEALHIPRVQQLSLDYRPNLIDAYVRGLTRERLCRVKPADLLDDGWTPAFLVGFPRSGTTMTEQILAAHSAIHTTDEKPYLEELRYDWARIVGANPDLGSMADQLDIGAIRQLRKAYREKVEADQGAPMGSKLIVDKLPLNIINIGFINLIFPEARIIVAIRDPRDACLSCFMQDFALNSAMIHFLTLDRAVRFYAQVMGAWLHFRNIGTLSQITLRYEDTVQNLEFEARRIIDHLDLDWEPGILHFHRHAAERVIATPSYVAVTEPVHTRAIGRWKNYEKQLGPLLPILDPFLREFGYENQPLEKP